MLPALPETAREKVAEKSLRRKVSSKQGAMASSEKWEEVDRRAAEIAMNRGKRPEEKGEKDTRRAKREMLGLQTLPNPDKP